MKKHLSWLPFAEFMKRARLTLRRGPYEKVVTADSIYPNIVVILIEQLHPVLFHLDSYFINNLINQFYSTCVENYIIVLPVNITQVWCAGFLDCTTHYHVSWLLWSKENKRKKLEILNYAIDVFKCLSLISAINCIPQIPNIVAIYNICSYKLYYSHLAHMISASHWFYCLKARIAALLVVK